MRVVIYGAGGVGGTIGARLHLAGTEVTLIARGAHLGALQESGLKFVAPDGEHRLDIPAVGSPDEIDWRPDDVVVLANVSEFPAGAVDALVAAVHQGLRLIMFLGDRVDPMRLTAQIGGHNMEVFG